MNIASTHSHKTDYGTAMSKETSLISRERIEHLILQIRGQQVLLDADLADLYRVETRILVRAMKRNLSRFPKDFMFQLNADEFSILRSHFGISSRWGGRRYPPYAFTEQGVAMLSSVLRSERAIQVNVEIMRTFVHLRRILASHEDLKIELDRLENKYDRKFRVVFEAIRQLMTQPARSRRIIGFQIHEKE